MSKSVIQRTMRTTTLVRHQTLQDALVTAAAALIAADGLGGLRARSLAEAAGCSVGAIYGVFPDLDALILAVNARTLGDIGQAMAAAEADDPAQHLVALAAAYLEYASEHRHGWSALFQHSMPGGQTAPDWYATQQAAAFSHIEAPLARLLPGLCPADCALLARTLFSAVHGMVALGLDEKVAAMPPAVLRDQVQTMVRAMARGLAA